MHPWEKKAKYFSENVLRNGKRLYVCSRKKRQRSERTGSLEWCFVGVDLECEKKLSKKLSKTLCGSKKG
ncbi:hypothetical protein M8845_16170, partial [Gelidibacter japonicus]|uniref:hypothetical protein n=1 Tax=Gelidibacter japonicus TaxID=1962232 RepID=UPI002022453A